MKMSEERWPPEAVWIVIVDKDEYIQCRGDEREISQGCCHFWLYWDENLVKWTGIAHGLQNMQITRSTRKSNALN